MRRVHRAGEKAFVDHSGKKLRLTDAITGELIEVELFVMVLGASKYTYAEATLTQTLADFVGATIRGFEYFGAVPEVVVPDQLRSAVKGPDRYEPDVRPGQPALRRNRRRESRWQMQLLQQLNRAKALILDDFGLRSHTHEEATALVDLLEERYQRSIVIITPQFDNRGWTTPFEDPVVAETFVDRLVHPSQRVVLKGGSYRERVANAKKST
jgi:hypothetical protein